MLRDDLPVRYDAGRVGPRRTDYPVWRRSPNEGSVGAPPAGPKFEAGPPSLPPPTPAPGQRRFNFLIVGLTILLAAGLVGGLLIYERKGNKKAIADHTTEDVQRAYLDYYAAEGQVLKTLDISPVKPFVTDAALKQE